MVKINSTSAFQTCVFRISTRTICNQCKQWTKKLQVYKFNVYSI